MKRTPALSLPHRVFPVRRRVPGAFTLIEFLVAMAGVFAIGCCRPMRLALKNHGMEPQ